MIHYRILVFSVICSLAMTYNSASAQTCNNNQLGGTVFRDYNSNGIQDKLEPGVKDIKITVVDGSSTEIATNTTDENGEYVVSVPNGLQVRVEFTDIPSYLLPGKTGNDSATTVKFLTNSSNCDVSLAVHNPAQHCGNDKSIATTCYVGTGVAGSASITVEIPYESGTTSITSNDGAFEPGYTLRSTQAQTGPIRGLAYHKITDVIIGSAYSKRHSGFPAGPDNTAPDKIWLIPRDGSAPSVFFSANAGNDNHDYVANSAGVYSDDKVWDDVGKTAWGDVNFNDSQTTLYASNQFDKNIYSIPVTVVANKLTAGLAEKISLAKIGDAECSDKDWVPGAVEAHDGQVYFGITCTAETSGNPADLKAIIVKYNEADSSLTAVTQFPLNYNRQWVSNDGSNSMSAKWNAWTDVLNTTLPVSVFSQSAYPQPWVTDIGFDESNHMIVAITDRGGDQYGSDNAGVGVVEGVAGGDTVKLFFNTTTKSWDSPDGDFYSSDIYAFNRTTPAHHEISLGGIAVNLGAGEVVSSAFDPAPVTGQVCDSTGTNCPFSQSFRAGGLIYMSHEDGSRTRSYQLFGLDTPGTFGKASGIGDVELICKPAPVEIGNRVWFDLNGNGEQDADEAPLAGVLVELVDVDSASVVCSAVTNPEGEYLFNSLTDDGDTTNHICGGIELGKDYKIKVPLNQPALVGFSLTTPDATTDTVDSDAVVAGSFAVIDVSKRAAGQNNHTFDFGFIQKVTIGDCIWIDTNLDGQRDSGEPGLDGVTVSIFDASGNKIASKITSADCKYVFTEGDGLKPDTKYTIVLDKPSDYQTGGPLSGLVETKKNTGNPTTDSDLYLDGDRFKIDVNTPNSGNEDLTFDGGLIRKVKVGNFVWIDKNLNGVQDSDESGLVGVTVSIYDSAGNKIATTITDSKGEYCFDETDGILPDTNYTIVFDNPTDSQVGGKLYGLMDTDKNSGSDTNIDSDLYMDGDLFKISITSPKAGEQDNSFDAGLTEKVLRIGNCAWIDENRNGLQDSNEMKITGVSVSIFDTSGTKVATTVTNVDGEYFFNRMDGLLPNTQYKVVFDNSSDYQPGGSLFELEATSKDAGDDADDSDVMIIDGLFTIDVLTPGLGEQDLTFDAGFIAQVMPTPTPTATPTIVPTVPPTPTVVPPVPTVVPPTPVPSLTPVPTSTPVPPVVKVRIGDYVWFDTNMDGQQSEGEPILVGVTVTLVDSNGQKVASKITDQNGRYFFDETDGVKPNETYTIIFDNEEDFKAGNPLGGLKLTNKNIGINSSDSDVFLQDNQFRIQVVSPAGNGEDLTYDAGFIPEAPIRQLRPTQFDIDGYGLELRNLVEQALNARFSGARNKRKHCNGFSGSKRDAKVADVANLYSANVWTVTWTKLEAESFDFNNSVVPAFCSVQNVEPQLNELRSSLKRIATIGRRALNRCNSNWKRAKVLKKKIKRSLKKSLGSVSDYPVELSSCK